MNVTEPLHDDIPFQFVLIKDIYIYRDHILIPTLLTPSCISLTLVDVMEELPPIPKSSSISIGPSLSVMLYLPRTFI